MRSLRVLAWMLALAGCSVGTGNTMVVHDAGRDSAAHDDANLAMDASDAAILPDVGNDAALDAPSIDVGPPDTNNAIDAGRDGGHDAAVITPPVVDGVVGGREWAAAVSSTSATATIWTGNQLMAIHAIAIGGTLYLAIEGQIESSNGMLVYIDGDPGGTHGVANLSSLTDSSASLDDAISAGFTTPATFRADVAWGTTLMSHVATSPDVTTGFRDITTDGSNFGWIPGASACTAAACEASITTSSLGPGPAPRTIQMFARIVQPDGLQSPNQTLPMDDATMPRVVSVVLVVHE